MEEEGGSALKQLYLRRFYSGTRPKNTLEKVISFQQKLKDFKVTKHPLNTRLAVESNHLLDEDGNRFRPSTNHSSHHSRKERHSFFQEPRRNEGPALAELRLILDRRDASQEIITDGKTERSLYTAHGRQRGKLLSQREISRQQGQPQDRISKINMTSFLQERNLTSSQKKTRPLIYIKKEHQASVKQNALDFQQNGKTVSRKVFIGGRDLQKAAEEYFKHYRQASKKIETAEVAKREKMAMPISDRKISERGRSHKGYKRSKVIISTQKSKNGPRTQPKAAKYEDLILNLDLDPWNVDADYF